jgi:hypothetical protein
MVRKRREDKMTIQTFITASPGTYYQEACVRKNFCKPEQHVVVDFAKWLDWYNAADTHSPKLHPPAFVGDSWEIANKVCDELNAGIKV